MTAQGPVRSRLERLWVTVVDATTYAAAVLLIATSAAFVLAVLTGGDLVRVKTLLFVAGWLLVTYATFRLWPRSPSDLEDHRRGTTETGRLQRFLHDKPPLRWLDPVSLRKESLSQAGKLFLGGVFVLATSFLMEVAGGVG